MLGFVEIGFTRTMKLGVSERILLFRDENFYLWAKRTECKTVRRMFLFYFSNSDRGISNCAREEERIFMGL